MFRNYVIRNFPFLEDDFDALTDYQLFSKFIGYVKKISNDNKEIIKKVDELEKYIKELPIQEEVNNKLDQMLADGDFDDMISYLTGTTLLNVVNELPEDKVENSLYEEVKSEDDLSISEIPVSNYEKVKNNNATAIENETNNIIKVATYNIENDDVPYTDGISGLEKINKLKNVFNNIGASIIGLNETFNGYLYPADKMYTTDYLKYAYFGKAMTGLTNYYYGNTTISRKNPVQSSTTVYLEVGADNEHRNVVKTVYTFNGKAVSHYNTHFTWDNDKVQNQIDELYNLVSNDTNEYIIISGDFNIDLSNASVYLSSFINDGYKLVNGGQYITNPSINSSIDEIMVSSNIDILNSGMLSMVETESLSDHLPIYANIELK